jgi:hypothetical protein
MQPKLALTATGAVCEWRIPMYATEEGPVPASVWLSASDSNVVLRYAISSPEPGTSTIAMSGLDLFHDDDVRIYFISPDGNRVTLAVVADAAGACTRIGSGLLSRPSSTACSVDKPVKPTPSHWFWSGSAKIPFSSIAPRGVPSSLKINVFVTHRIPNGTPVGDAVNYSSRPPHEKTPLSLELRLRDAASTQRYVLVAENAGSIQGAPPHRANVLAYLPIDDQNALGAAFADYAKPLTSIRDSELKTIFSKDQYQQLACVSCDSFQTVAPTAYDRTIDSTTILGTDLSSIGLDSVPFSTDSISYPVDSEIGGGGLDQQVAVATFNGETAKNGHAHDQVLRGVTSLPFSTGQLDVSFFDVDSWRTLLSTKKVGTYAPDVNPYLHTATSEVSVGLRTSNAPADAEGALEYDRPVWEEDLLVRAGDQYGGTGSSRLDVGVTITRAHALASDGKPTNIVDDLSLTVGSRDVGTDYRPLDGSADPIVGLHGYYANLANSTARTGALKPLQFSVFAYTFGDAVEARDVAVSASGSIPFAVLASAGSSSPFTMTANITTKEIAQSLVSGSFSSPFILPDRLGGAAYLPNGSYSINLGYTKASASLALGVTGGNESTCDVSAKISPCYAYGERGIIVNAYDTFASQYILAISQKKTDDNSLALVQELGSTILGPSTEPIVENRLVRSAGAAIAFGKPRCSSVTATTSNQSAPLESFISSAPQPGFTTTYGLDTVALHFPGALFVGFLRTSVPQPVSQFIVRLSIGQPTNNFEQALSAVCSARQTSSST